MPDYGSRVTDKAVADTAKKLRETYRIAQRELREKLKDFEKRHERIDREKRQKLAEGKITLAEYKTWLSGQVFIRKQWENQIKQVSETLRRSNEEAVKIINERRLDVFAENYNYTAFHAEAVTGINFNIYNTQAVAKLIQDDPQILPEWKIDEQKDYQWDYKKVNNIVKQGIIQGESIPEISSRLVTDLCAMSARKMMTFARTAYTGAQNAGRQQQMDEAAKMGIEQHKVWIAVFDNRTRDVHRDLDGQEVPYDKSFDSQLGPIRFPGDPSAEPANVYNCRCQMVTIYPDYEDWSLEHWREDETYDGQSYQEWKKGKQKRGEVQETPTKKKPTVAFTPAKTIEEAEAYALEMFGVKNHAEMSYHNIDSEYANICNRVLTEVKGMYDSANEYANK